LNNRQNKIGPNENHKVMPISGIAVKAFNLMIYDVHD